MQSFIIRTIVKGDETGKGEVSGHVARRPMGETKNYFTILIGKFQVNKPIGRHRPTNHVELRIKMSRCGLDSTRLRYRIMATVEEMMCFRAGISWGHIIIQGRPSPMF
jgi:hypothetical protein